MQNLYIERICDFRYFREKWFNKDILNNPEQQRAVTNIIGKTSYPAPYILFGPPGTGKTVTLVEAITQVIFDCSRHLNRSEIFGKTKFSC